MAEAGNGRNFITQQLKLANIRISSGSVSNIISAWKESKRENNSAHVIAATATTDQPSESVDKIISAESQNQGQDPKSQLSQEFHREFLSDASISIITDSDVNNISSLASDQQHGARLASESSFNQEQEIDFADEPFDSASTDSNNDVIENEIRTEPTVPTETSSDELESRQEECDLGINWDSDRTWEMRLMRKVVQNKIQRHQELLRLKQQNQRLEAKRQLITQMKNED